MLLLLIAPTFVNIVIKLRTSARVSKRVAMDTLKFALALETEGMYREHASIVATGSTESTLIQYLVRSRSLSNMAILSRSVSTLSLCEPKQTG